MNNKNRFKKQAATGKSAAFFSMSNVQANAGETAGL